MDILADVNNRVRPSRTLLFHCKLGRPWNATLSEFPDAVFHSRGEPQVLRSDSPDEVVRCSISIGVRRIFGWFVTAV